MSDLTDLVVPHFAHVHHYAGAWAIEPQSGQALWDLARGKNLFAHVALRRAGMDDDGGTAPKPKSAIEMSPDGRGKSVATVRVEGTLMKRSSSLSASSGTVQMRRDIRKAADDSDVSAILLAIDSPGGTVAGTDDLAQDVRNAAKKKPVYAYVSDLCASAAYWVASQCDAIFANSETALVGSIGTLLTVYDVSKAAEKQGVEAIVFRTGPIKGAGTEGEVISDEQRAYFQSIVDDTQKTFDAAVKKGRGLTDTQLKAVRTGGVFKATEAEQKKLIDGVRTQEQVFAALVKEAYSRGRPAPRSATGGDVTAAVGAAFDDEFSQPRPARTAASDPVPTRGAVMSREATDDTVDLTPAGGTTATADPHAAGRKAAAAEFRRIAAIQSLDGAGKQPGVVADAIENGWSVEKAELAVMKANLPKVSPGNPTAGGDTTIVSKKGKDGPPDRQVVEAALLLSHNIPPEHWAKGIPAADRERVMNTATSGEYQGYSLHALMDDTIRASGRTFRGNRKSIGFARAAEEANREMWAEEKAARREADKAGVDLQASGQFSTISLSGTLSNVANKSLLTGYTAAVTTWRSIAGIRSHNDFKTVTRYRLDGNGALKKVGPDGELKHIGLSEGSYTNRLETFGGILGLTRQMMINDDMGAFTELPLLLGDMGANRVEEGVYVLVLANTGSFFSVGNKNLLTGGGSALAVDGVAMGAAETNFLKQVNSNGKPIQMRPSVLAVPTALAFTADQLYTTAALSTGANATIANQNKFAGRYPPVVSPYLDNTAITDQDGAALSGQSSTAWYLFAAPGARAAVGVAFLNGQQNPTIEMEETTFNTLGQQWRVYLDFGVGFEDPTAALKNAGA